MKYLLDTCIISDFVKGREPVVERLLGLAPRDVAISTITRMEVEYGLQLNPGRARKLRKPLHAMFSSVELLPFSDDDALAAARVRARLKAQGAPIGPYDLLLAGTAVARALTFVTANYREFSRVQGLKVERW